jgi:replication-associated recombination protein RarA
MAGKFNPRTVNGHLAWEVVSALQKAVRRGNLDDAIYWAVDLDLSGFADWLWGRIKVIVSEDIGPGTPMLPVQVDTLHRWWQESKKKQGHPYERLHLVHAIVLCCRATKSRLVPNALLVHYMEHEAQRREIPDYALDMHTARGKRQGRGIDHFLDEAAKVEPSADGFDQLEGPYRERVRDLYRAGNRHGLMAFAQAR